MESLPIAFVAGVGLGVLDAVVRWNFSKQSVTTVAFLIVILVALLLQRERGRRENAEESSLSTAAAAASAIPLRFVACRRSSPPEPSGSACFSSC